MPIAGIVDSDVSCSRSVRSVRELCGLFSKLAFELY